MKVLVELDRWGERGKIGGRLDPSGDPITITIGTVWNARRAKFKDAIYVTRSIQRGDYRFAVTVEEYRGETTFLLRASLALLNSARKGRVSRKTALRERPLTPVTSVSGDVYWTLNREGVFAVFPPEWDEYWANGFIKETLDFLRSLEIPKHFELHGDNPEEM